MNSSSSHEGATKFLSRYNLWETEIYIEWEKWVIVKQAVTEKTILGGGRKTGIVDTPCVE